ncbi:hypothetical protein LOK49_LG12G01678 [Camellia lanceoleosa]|uniref:Uncharacterized protein n=1 Tax=Camellia lanceoleosa TaxID=1840588 RepID=A0ACC0FPY4_9ERIC|nr:hypothetical protein LOK49_LG12G01678 [Camellia lanceoleosa]
MKMMVPVVNLADSYRVLISTSPPVPPPKPSSTNSFPRRSVSGSSNSLRSGSPRRAAAWPIVSTRTLPTGLGLLHPGLIVKVRVTIALMSRALHLDLLRRCNQVYGDSDAYDLVRQMCIDYMRNVDKDQIKAVIKAQQDQQINNALLAEGRFYSDLELTEKEIERMVMETSRAEFNQQLGWQESSTAGAEPSSSGARSSGSETQVDGGRERGLSDTVLSSMQIVLSMGFSYLQVIEAYNIFGDDVDSVVCYLLETGGSSSRRKGKAAE